MGWQDAPVIGGWQSAPAVEAEKAAPVTDFSGTLRFGPIDTGISLPDAVNRRLAQFGSGMADWMLGGQQMAGSATPQDAFDKRKVDAQLNDGLLGKALHVAGNIAPALALPFGYASALGRAAPIIEGLVAGGAQGAFQPVAPGESRTTNVALGAGAGTVVPAAVQGYRVLATPSTQTADLARKAIDQYGIPLGVADIAENKLVKGARSYLNDMPITGGMGAADRQAVQGGFNRAVGNTFGADEASLTPTVMANAKGKITNELNRVWNNNNLTLDGQLMGDFSGIAQRAQSLNPEQAAAVDRQVQNLLRKVDTNGEIPGSFVNNWQSELRMLADGETGLQQNVLQQLRQSVIGAFNRSVTGPDATALATARGQYRALKTVEPLLSGAEAGVAGRAVGDVPASLLPAQVVRQYGTQIASSPFADLAPIGSRFLVDRTPQTGGSARALIQGLTLGSLGGAGALGYGVPAAAAAGAGAAVAGAGVAANIGLQGLFGSTKAAQALLSPTAQRGLFSGSEMGPALRELLATSMQRAPIPLGLNLAVPAAALE